MAPDWQRLSDGGSYAEVNGWLLEVLPESSGTTRPVYRARVYYKGKRGKLPFFAGDSDRTETPEPQQRAAEAWLRDDCREVLRALEAQLREEG